MRSEDSDQTEGMRRPIRVFNWSTCLIVPFAGRPDHSRFKACDVAQSLLLLFLLSSFMFLFILLLLLMLFLVWLLVPYLSKTGFGVTSVCQ